jgi:hypothetical protein
MHLLQKEFIKKILVLVCIWRTICPLQDRGRNDGYVNFSFSNVYEVVDNNSDHYRSMVMSAMRMNQDNASECSIIDKKPNVDATRFLNLLKDSNKPL